MQKKQAQKTSRLALFSENERDYLKGKKTMDIVRKSQFHHILDKRFDALLKDLDLLGRSDKLKSWRSLRVWKYNYHLKATNYFNTLFSDIQRGYQSAIRRVSTGKGKNKKSLYWLDNSPINDTKIDERIFNPNFLFRHVKIGLTENDKKIFLNAVEHGGILGFKKEDAINMTEIKRRLSGESKIRTNEKKIPIITDETFSDSRNFAINKIVNKHVKHNFKVLNTKLKNYDSKVIQYFVNPYYHPESG